MFHVKHRGATMRLPPDWTGEATNGYFPHLVNLVHTPCGFRSGMAYDLWGSEPFGEAAAVALVYGHECEPDD